MIFSPNSMFSMFPQDHTGGAQYQLPSSPSTYPRQPHYINPNSAGFNSTNPFAGWGQPLANLNQQSSFSGGGSLPAVSQPPIYASGTPNAGYLQHIGMAPARTDRARFTGTLSPNSMNSVFGANNAPQKLGGLLGLQRTRMPKRPY